MLIQSAQFSFACFQGGEAETNRTHVKREENIAGRVFSIPRQIGVLFQGGWSDDLSLNDT